MLLYVKMLYDIIIKKFHWPLYYVRVVVLYQGMDKGSVARTTNSTSLYIYICLNWPIGVGK